MCLTIEVGDSGFPNFSGSLWEQHILCLSGETVIDARQEEKDKVFETAPHLRGMYDKPDSPVLASFYVKNGEATFCSLSAAPRTVKI